MAVSLHKASSVEPVKPIHVLIVDDFPLVRAGLATAINRQKDMKTVGEASDGRTALEKFCVHRPDIVLLDVRMPRFNGIAATTAIRSVDPEARIILISGFDTDEYIYEGVRAGAKAYLLKTMPVAELLDAIRKVHAGETCIPPAIASKLVERVTREELSAREVEVLRLVVAGKSNKEIGVSLCICEGTVKVHVGNLLKKLKASGRTEAINLALTHGIIDVTEPSEEMSNQGLNMRPSFGKARPAKAPALVAASAKSSG